MKPFKRTTEKVLAWIANVLLIFFTSVVSWLAFSGILTTVTSDQSFINELNQQFMEANLADISAIETTRLLLLGFKVGAFIYIILTIIAVVASLVMKSRILSGSLFLIAAIGVGVASVGVLVPIYLLYFIAAIMMFVRKEEVYTNQNPYVNNGDNNYDQGNNAPQDQYNQNVEGVNYKTTSQEAEKIDKIEYL